MNSAISSRKCFRVFLSISFAASGVLYGPILRAQSPNPVPLINQPLVPDATAPGGPQFTLTVNGTGFVSNSTLNWNGSPLATMFVSGSQLTAVVPATDIATASTGWVTVVNPAPGGGTSNTAFFTVAPNTGNSVGFSLVSSPATGIMPVSMAAGDFNRDGEFDLAVANEGSNTVSILLGDGTGNFSLASSPATGSEPESVAIGDFNRDGKLDLAVANQSDDTLSILLGDGTGNFTLASSPAECCSSSVAAGDFNGDGNLDLAAGDDLQGSVSILLGDGTGNFTLASSLGTGAVGPSSIAVGDFNGDGKLDLVAATNAWNPLISVLLGDGTGNFTLASSRSGVADSVSAVVGDFNGDGKLDLSVGGTLVGNYLGDGHGNFTLISTSGCGSGSESVALGDFNNDGDLDQSVADRDSNFVAVNLGNGLGGFRWPCWLDLAVNEPYSMALGDFNGDGELDLAWTNAGTGTLSVLLATPAASLSPTSLDFGTQLIGTKSGAQWVTLSNTGGASLADISISASSNFAQTNTCGTSLSAGASCTITAIFLPRGSGTLTGMITITDNASDSPQTLALTGTGTLLSVTPASLSFNPQLLGTTSTAQTMTVTNNRYRVLTIRSTRIGGADSGDFAQTNTCGTGLPAGGSCTISVTFTPQATGSRRATIAISDNDGSQTVTLKGYGM